MSEKAKPGSDHEETEERRWLCGRWVTRAELEELMLDMEAKGLLRRVGIRDGKIVWSAVKPS